MALVDTIELYKVLADFALTIMQEGWGIAYPRDDFELGTQVQGSGRGYRIIDDHQQRGIFEALATFIEVDLPEDLDLTHFAIAADLDRVLYPPVLHVHLREEGQEKLHDRE